MVAKPSPPEICWNLIEPPTGFWSAAADNGGLGCRVVLIGHCTRKLVAPATVANNARARAITRCPSLGKFNMSRPPSRLRADRAAPVIAIGRPVASQGPADASCRGALAWSSFVAGTSLVLSIAVHLSVSSDLPDVSCLEKPERL